MYRIYYSIDMFSFQSISPTPKDRLKHAEAVLTLATRKVSGGKTSHLASGPWKKKLELYFPY